MKGCLSWLSLSGAFSAALLGSSGQVKFDLCPKDLEIEGRTYDCGFVCKAFSLNETGTCPSDNVFEEADLTGECGTNGRKPCAAIASTAYDVLSSTCGMCYEVTTFVGVKRNIRVVGMEAIEKIGRFRIPMAVFNIICPFHCRDGECRATAELCDAKGGLAEPSDDCMAKEAEVFDYKILPNCGIPITTTETPTRTTTETTPPAETPPTEEQATETPSAETPSATGTPPVTDIPVTEIPATEEEPEIPSDGGEPEETGAAKLISLSVVVGAAYLTM